MARPEAMVQLGQVIRRIIHLMAEYRHHVHPFKFAKLDVKDVFWRMSVDDVDAWNLCYVLPSLKERTLLDDIEIVVPNKRKAGFHTNPFAGCLEQQFRCRRATHVLSRMAGHNKNSRRRRRQPTCAKTHL